MQAKRARLEVKGIVKRTSTPKGKGKVKPKQPKQQYGQASEPNLVVAFVDTPATAASGENWTE